MPKPTPLIAGNWKMNMTVAQASVLMHRLDDQLDKTEAEVVVCPPFTALQPLSKDINREKFQLGAQNIYFQDEGAYTGEISGVMLENLVEYVIVGHSERRHYFGETDETIAKKISAARRHSLTPILCVGENLLERQEQHTDLVLNDQLTADLAMLTAGEVPEIVIAYEPLWAIGSGDIAKPDQITKALATIRRVISEIHGKQAARTVRLLYGGSVQPDYVVEYAKQVEGLNGFLVGGASLNWQQFSEIVKLSEEHF